jgi:hypothetical protein
MVKSYAEILYNDIKEKGLFPMFSTKNDPTENYGVLDNILADINIAKCNIAETEMREAGSSLQLKYLLQNRNGIDFNICPEFKVWKNREGWQYGCRKDKGKGRRIQVHCYGKYPERCERLDDL